MPQILLRTLFAVTLYGLLLFVPAWTLDWWRAWVLLALIFAGMIATRLWAFGADQTLLEERRKPPLQQGQPLADKVLVIGFVIVFPAYIAFLPLDVFHFHVFGKPPIGVSSLGLVLACGGWCVISLAFRENAFAAAIVKPQEERGQTVVDSGIYGVIRHPLYAGVVLALVGVALWLESTAGALLSIVPIAMIVMRIVVEENFLRRRLSGYDAYARRVERRLIPLVW
ncbi:MAG: isoprenylcysteine carboxylmethyltransferase family protein [Candidatus Velthaea sp.]|jgi:protein-S-isoprenylcysteine O-methyltransferase Ste14